jgi:Rieske Fe-S protein
MSRRTFIKTAIIAGCTALIPGIPLTTYTIFPSLKEQSSNWIDFGPVQDLQPDNFNMLSYEFMVKDGWIVLPQRGFIWARIDGGQQMKIFSSTCSHLACNVIWQEETREFVCPCHSGRFNAEGQPIAGPPSRPLSVLDHKVEDDNLLVFMTV